MVPLVQGGVLGFLPGQVMTSLTSRCWCFSFLLQLITRNPQTLGSSPALTGTISPRASTPGLWGALVSTGLPGPTSSPRLTCHIGPHRFRPHSGSQPLFHLKGWLVESSMNWGHFPLQPASMPNPPEPQTIVLYRPGSNSVSVQGKEEQQVKYLGKEHWHSLCKIIPSKGGKGCQMRADTLGRDSPSLITVLFYLIKLCMTAKG